MVAGSSSCTPAAPTEVSVEMHRIMPPNSIRAVVLLVPNAKNHEPGSARSEDIKSTNSWADLIFRAHEDQRPPARTPSGPATMMTVPIHGPE